MESRNYVMLRRTNFKNKRKKENIRKRSKEYEYAAKNIEKERKSILQERKK